MCVCLGCVQECIRCSISNEHVCRTLNNMFDETTAYYTMYKIQTIRIGSCQYVICTEKWKINEKSWVKKFFAIAIYHSFFSGAILFSLFLSFGSISAIFLCLALQHLSRWLTWWRSKAAKYHSICLFLCLSLFTLVLAENRYFVIVTKATCTHLFDLIWMHSRRPNWVGKWRIQNAIERNLTVEYFMRGAHTFLVVVFINIFFIHLKTWVNE